MQIRFMSNNIDLSIILPSYMEEENLRILLPRIRHTADEISNNYEIMVVDTAFPMDGTKEACFENNVSYLNREGGDFYGDAIRTGINKAKGTHIVFMDADGSHYPTFIKNLYEHCNNYDVVIASRYIKGGQTENPKILILLSKIVNICYSLVLGIKCQDISNSFKLYRSDLLKDLSLKCKNFDIVEEILFKI